MTRPLRSLAIGDQDHYLSPLLFGVGQAMARLGHWHSTINIRSPFHVIAQRIRDLRPDVIWGHMILWAPEGAPARERLIALMAAARKDGALVVLHDGDYKPACRYPHDISDWCALALTNHDHDRSAWKIPRLHWPYFAFDQDRLALPDPKLACELWFAGQVGQGPVYSERSAFLERLRGRGIDLRTPALADGNTLFRTAEIAASAGAVLGFGRPDAKGWTDTRVFQYPGAGAILVHDDVRGYLEPWVHYAPYHSGDADSVLEALARLRAMTSDEKQLMRSRAFAHVQQHHSATARVTEALRALGLMR